MLVAATVSVQTVETSAMLMKSANTPGVTAVTSTKLTVTGPQSTAGVVVYKSYPKLGTGIVCGDG